jgi:predicted transcriptional regulator
MELEDFKNKLEEANLNLKDFARLVNIPYSTVTKYGRSTPIASWIEPFLNIYIENQKLESVKQEIKDLADRL